MPAGPPRRSGCWTACFTILVIFLCLGLCAAAYLLAPARTNVLILGIDRAPDGTNLSRTDTNILVTVLPLEPYIGMLSIPRDLWVEIPGVGENRINTAHFFAESNLPGSGPAATIETIKHNFGVDVDYYLRIRFDGITGIVDAMGGLDLTLDEPTAGYPAGSHHLNGEQALAFVRDRAGTDDFFRMANGQLFLRQAMKQLLSPASWPRLPAVIGAVQEAVDTNIPLWQLPRLGVAILRAGPEGIDSRVISREMVNPFTTSGGAQVLGPNWELINPLVDEMFGPF
jgi:LCP family protein required for cell wall assembly